MSLKRVAAAAVIAASLAWSPAWAQETCTPAPVAVVAQFLHLTPEQGQQFGRLLQARQAALESLRPQIAEREAQIRKLLDNGGDPAVIGTLMHQVHQLQQLAAAAQAQFLTAFAGLLTEEQRRQWVQVRGAAALEPVLPAFRALQLW